MTKPAVNAAPQQKARPIATTLSKMELAEAAFGGEGGAIEGAGGVERRTALETAATGVGGLMTERAVVGKAGGPVGLGEPEEAVAVGLWLAAGLARATTEVDEPADGTLVSLDGVRAEEVIGAFDPPRAPPPGDMALSLGSPIHSFAAADSRVMMIGARAGFTPAG
jgi:hypothetical protein